MVQIQDEHGNMVTPSGVVMVALKAPACTRNAPRAWACVECATQYRGAASNRSLLSLQGDTVVYLPVQVAWENGVCCCKCGYRP